MPTYSYKCNDCHADLEIKATVEEKVANKSALFFCSACGSTNVKQEFNLNALVKKAARSGDSCCGGDGAGGNCSC